MYSLGGRVVLDGIDGTEHLEAPRLDEFLVFYLAFLTIESGLNVLDDRRMRRNSFSTERSNPIQHDYCTATVIEPKSIFTGLFAKSAVCVCELNKFNVVCQQ